MVHLQTKNFLIAIIFDYTSWEKITVDLTSQTGSKDKEGKKR